MTVSLSMLMAPLDMSAAPVAASSPDLPEHEFLNEVLHLPNEDFEAYLEGLIKRAAQLGISISSPRSAKSIMTGKRNTSGADSNVTIDTNHVRTVSTSSQDSADTILTSPSSKDSVHELPESILSRKRPQTLTFAQYETYLTLVDKPTADQPKFLASPHVPEKATASVFSMSTRKSYKSLKQGLSKMRRKRKSVPSPEAIYV